MFGIHILAMGGEGVPDIVIEHLYKSYGDRAVLRDVCLRFPAGRVSCLMAPSGAGKTTLLRLLMGLEAPDRGRIAGLECLTVAPVFQENRLLEPLDARANLRLVSPNLGSEEMQAALARFGLQDSARQPVSELSGGMRRRLALLRALLSKGDVLLMDEPFTGLDEATRARIVRETLALIAGRTAILVTHDPDEAALTGAEVFRL